jgi:Mn2+/Fe2+ NRAMP family transporter
MPQFSLGTAAMQQNLGIDIPDWACTLILFIIAGVVIWFYDAGGWGIKLFEILLKILVAFIVLAFFGVVIALAVSGKLNGGAILGGFIPDFSLLTQPAEALRPYIEASSNPDYWTAEVVSIQRNTMIAAAATAVGINMTFLLPYSLKKKGWGKAHRQLSRFDLVLGLFVPFILGASALVIASAASFHAKHADVLAADGTPFPEMEQAYYKVLDGSLTTHHEAFITLDVSAKNAARASVSIEEKQLAAMLSNRDSVNLAQSLEPFLGKHAQTIFGIGVLAMAISTLLVHMMMNGYAISEAFNKVGNAKIFIIGASMPAIAGFFSPYLWSGDAKAAMAIPASVIATTLLPIAYLAFLLLMNSKSALGDNLPKNRILINTLMVLSAGVATFASIWALSNKGTPGLIGIAGLLILAVMGLTGFASRNRSTAH